MATVALAAVNSVQPVVQFTALIRWCCRCRPCWSWCKRWNRQWRKDASLVLFNGCCWSVAGGCALLLSGWLMLMLLHALIIHALLLRALLLMLLLVVNSR